MVGFLITLLTLAINLHRKLGYVTATVILLVSNILTCLRGFHTYICSQLSRNNEYILLCEFDFFGGRIFTICYLNPSMPPLAQLQTDNPSCSKLLTGLTPCLDKWSRHAWLCSGTLESSWSEHKSSCPQYSQSQFTVKSLKY